MSKYATYLTITKASGCETPEDLVMSFAAMVREEGREPSPDMATAFNNMAKAAGYDSPESMAVALQAEMSHWPKKYLSPLARQGQAPPLNPPPGEPQ